MEQQKEEIKQAKLVKAEEAKQAKAEAKAQAKRINVEAKAQAKLAKAEAKAEAKTQAKAEKAKQKIINKGTGAGGANTNKTGKPFEENTNYLHFCTIKTPTLSAVMSEQGGADCAFQMRNGVKQMFDRGFVSHKHGVTKTFEDKTVVIVSQRNLANYAKDKYGIGDIYRCPDEAYIIEYASGKKVIKILEKKMQNVDGSVETKLLAGPSLKREYELMFGPDFEIQYGLCVSEFLQKKITSETKKYNNLQQILAENNIPILFGNDANYFETLELWIHQ